MYLLFPILLYFSIFKLYTATSCKTPSGENGNCISIYNCTKLLDALATFNDTQIQFVKKSQCGYEKSPLVCCPITVVTDNSKQNVQDIFKNRKYCGYQHFDDYLTKKNAIRASIDEFPWLASLMFLTDSKEIMIACSGSLINERYVLTAAHCTLSPSYVLVGVRLGEHNLELAKDCADNTDMEDCSDPVQEYDIAEVLKHPGYSHRTKSDDIALLRLNQTVVFSDYIRPICLPFSGVKLAQIGEEMIVSGWGVTSDAGKTANVKKKVRVELQSNEKCKSFYGKRSRAVNITEKQTCMLPKSNNQDLSCQGDSGGPVMFANKNQWHVQGIISFGAGCSFTAPDVNTNVGSYLDWIVKNIKD